MILVLLIPMGSWDIRKNVITGQLDALRRYTNSMLEDIATQARSRRNSSDLNEFSIITDMNGFDRRKHGCTGC